VIEAYALRVVGRLNGKIGFMSRRLRFMLMYANNANAMR
jgi:uncharacterized protein YlbG (UPF0298 family)